MEENNYKAHVFRVPGRGPNTVGMAGEEASLSIRMAELMTMPSYPASVTPASDAAFVDSRHDH